MKRLIQMNFELQPRLVNNCFVRQSALGEGGIGGRHKGNCCLCFQLFFGESVKVHIKFLREHNRILEYRD